jgi:nitroreductase
MDGINSKTYERSRVNFLHKPTGIFSFRPEGTILRMNNQIEEWNRLVRNRRSVFPRQFAEGRIVPDEIIMQILENATWAPSHGQTEPWQFVVFSGKGLQKLAEFQGKLYKEAAGGAYKESKYQNLLENPLKSSHVIALCMKRDPLKKHPEVEEIAAVAAAVQNIYLSVTAYGLGGYWTTGGITYFKEAKPFFGLGEDDKLLGFFYLGYVAVPSPPGKRTPIAEKLRWVRD